jgi:hypothetical protein
MHIVGNNDEICNYQNTMTFTYIVVYYYNLNMFRPVVTIGGGRRGMVWWWLW